MSKLWIFTQTVNHQNIQPFKPSNFSINFETSKFPTIAETSKFSVIEIPIITTQSSKCSSFRITKSPNFQTSNFQNVQIVNFHPNRQSSKRPTIQTFKFLDKFRNVQISNYRRNVQIFSYRNTHNNHSEFKISQCSSFRITKSRNSPTLQTSPNVILSDNESYVPPTPKFPRLVRTSHLTRATTYNTLTYFSNSSTADIYSGTYPERNEGIGSRGGKREWLRFLRLQVCRVVRGLIDDFRLAFRQVASRAS